MVQSPHGISLPGPHHGLGPHHDASVHLPPDRFLLHPHPSRPSSNLHFFVPPPPPTPSPSPSPSHSMYDRDLVRPPPDELPAHEGRAAPAGSFRAEALQPAAAAAAAAAATPFRGHQPAAAAAGSLQHRGSAASSFRLGGGVRGRRMRFELLLRRRRSEAIEAASHSAETKRGEGGPREGIGRDRREKAGSDRRRHRLRAGA